jgi:hypothetical protein
LCKARQWTDFGIFCSIWFLYLDFKCQRFCIWIISCVSGFFFFFPNFFFLKDFWTLLYGYNYQSIYRFGFCWSIASYSNGVGIAFTVHLYTWKIKSWQNKISLNFQVVLPYCWKNSTSKYAVLSLSAFLVSKLHKLPIRQPGETLTNKL